MAETGAIHNPTYKSFICYVLATNSWPKEYFGNGEVKASITAHTLHLKLNCDTIICEWALQTTKDSAS